MLGVQRTTHIGISFVLVLLLASMGMVAWAESGATVTYGADINPTGDPIGGGKGYREYFHEGDFTVSTVEELIAALGRARSGQVIVVAPQAEIDLTGHVKVPISPGVVLAGHRGLNGASGPLIYTDEFDTFPLLYADEGVRITGLRLRGPDPETQDSAYGLPNSAAIETRGSRVEVDNNEIFNWSYAGVYVRHPQAYVHHNVIHHVRRTGLGYPVSVNQGTAVIEANYIDWYRHAIASSGMPGSGYEARYNLIGPHATSFAFDMHGGADWCPKRTTPCSPEEQRMGGEWIRVYYNTFHVTQQRAIGIRGVPLQGGEIYGNWFAHTQPHLAVGFLNYLGNVAVFDNAYGPDQVVVDRYLDSSPLIRRCGSGWCPLDNPRLPVVGAVAPVQIGFVHPKPGEHFALVRGRLPIEVVVETAGYLEVNYVEVLLDDQLLYKGKQAPAPGEITVDTLELQDGPYQLRLVVSTNEGVELAHTAKVRVSNWWSKEDPLDAPVRTAWFGTISRLRTDALSDGWVHAEEGEAHLFFGDEGRLTRLHSSTEYLQWQATRLREARVVLYVRGSLSGRWVTFQISSDGETWNEIPYGVSSTETVGEWTRHELVATADAPPEAEWFRLQVSEAASADSLQLGEVQLRGLQAGEE